MWPCAPRRFRPIPYIVIPDGGWNGAPRALSGTRFEQHFNTVNKLPQLLQPLWGGFNPLFLPHKPGAALVGNTNRQISLQEHARLAKQAETSIGGRVQQRGVLSLSNSNRVGVKRKRDHGKAGGGDALQGGQMLWYELQAGLRGSGLKTV
jgi:hypothetical protein